MGQQFKSQQDSKNAVHSKLIGELFKNNSVQHAEWLSRDPDVTLHVYFWNDFKAQTLTIQVDQAKENLEKMKSPNPDVPKQHGCVQNDLKG